jgi:hypothetical protein
MWTDDHVRWLTAIHDLLFDKPVECDPQGRGGVDPASGSLSSGELQPEWGKRDALSFARLSECCPKSAASRDAAVGSWRTSEIDNLEKALAGVLTEVVWAQGVVD